MDFENVTYEGPAVSDAALLKRLPDDLKAILSGTNGFVAFEGGSTSVVFAILPPGILCSYFGQAIRLYRKDIRMSGRRISPSRRIVWGINSF